MREQDSHTDDDETALVAGDEEPESEVNAVDPTEARRRARFIKFIQWGGAPLGAALYWIARSQYYEAYARALGLPSELGIVPPISVASILGWAMGGLCVANLISLFAASHDAIRSTARGRAAVRLFGALLASGWLSLLLHDAYGGAAWMAGFILLGVVLFLEAMAVFVHHRRHPTLEARLEASEEAEARLFTISDRIRPWGGRPAVLVLVATMLVLSHAGLKARADARSKKEWTVVRHPQMPPHEDWVLIARDGDRLIVRRIDGSEFTGPLRSVTGGAAESIEYDVRNLGRLHLPERGTGLPVPPLAPQTGVARIRGPRVFDQPPLP